MYLQKVRLMIILLASKNCAKLQLVFGKLAVGVP